ncbi:hypothetical protein ANN_21508 [Periplaneta americana]|uniref:Uncharacterized protein n=1 Tax=Periplaneta americana TaxID=6978 RepID=A0ABQ8SFH0_PERAM|nr:hypothetical protein ANN_21508 [Periplaneta americana]
MDVTYLLQHTGEGEDVQRADREELETRRRDGETSAYSDLECTASTSKKSQYQSSVIHTADFSAPVYHATEDVHWSSGRNVGCITNRPTIGTDAMAGLCESGNEPPDSLKVI